MLLETLSKSFELAHYLPILAWKVVEPVAFQFYTSQFVERMDAPANLVFIAKWHISFMFTIWKVNIRYPKMTLLIR